jgi:hypothetical protein
LWSDRYDRGMEDIFAVQDEISESIAAALDRAFSSFSTRAVETARLGPAGTSDDIMGPDGYRTSLLSQAGMPEQRNAPRFARPCARLGLVEFWTATGKWPDCADEVPYAFRAGCEKARHVPREDVGF